MHDEQWGHFHSLDMPKTLQVESSVQKINNYVLKYLLPDYEKKEKLMVKTKLKILRHVGES